MTRALLLLSLVLVASSVSRANVLDGLPATRSVIHGDLVYRASAIAADHGQAAYLAEAHAAHLLAVECGAPPRGSRVYSQTVAQQPDRSFLASVELGVAIEDCEQTRAIRLHGRAASEKLTQAAAYYERTSTGVTTQLPVISRVAVPEVLWGTDQEISHLRALARRTENRLQERARLTQEP